MICQFNTVPQFIFHFIFFLVFFSSFFLVDTERLLGGLLSFSIGDKRHTYNNQACSREEQPRGTHCEQSTVAEMYRVYYMGGSQLFVRPTPKAVITTGGA